MIKKIKELQSKLDGRLVITGSYALAKYNMAESSQIHDIDLILVEPTEKDLLLLKNISELFPASSPINKDYPHEVECQFRWRTLGCAIDVDIFLDKSLTNIDSYLSFDGVLINPVINILRAKRKMNRKKDNEFFVKLIHRISKIMTDE